ncbi:hypothetical protein ACFL59_00070 [Planctomycetota bacterium]
MEGLLGLLALSKSMAPALGLLVLITIAFPAALFWIIQFAQLMSLEDELFPSRHDKILWFIALLVANVLGAGAFWMWKRAMLEAKRLERRRQNLGGGTGASPQT